MENSPSICVSTDALRQMTFWEINLESGKHNLASKGVATLTQTKEKWSKKTKKQKQNKEAQDKNTEWFSRMQVDGTRTERDRQGGKWRPDVNC